MLRRKYLIPAAIVGFWLVMTGILVQREVLVPYAAPGGARGPIKPFDSWMGIYLASNSGQEKHVGYLNLVAAPDSRGEAKGTAYNMRLKLSTVLFSAPTELTVVGSTWIDNRTGLSDFDFQVQQFDRHVMKVSGRVTDGRLSVEIETAGETFPLELEMGEDLLVSGNMGTTVLNLPSLDVGEVVMIDAFDPLTLSTGKARIECIDTETLLVGGDEILTKVLTTTISGVSSKVWVSTDDEVIRLETPFGFVLRKTSAREAMRRFTPGGGADLLDRVAIEPTGKQPYRGIKSMTFRISGVPVTLDLPTDDNQVKSEDGTYTIASPGVPVRADVSGLVGAEEYLAGDPFVQVDHPLLVGASERIVGEETDPWAQANALYTWVYENIEKRSVLTFPSALDVLDTLEGDCNEHTVLFAALSRTLDIPTRIAIGVVWSNEFGGFYYHAWPEVFVGHWIPMDPTLGQPIADATHIKLIEGSIEAWVGLTPYLGQLEIEVLDLQ